MGLLMVPGSGAILSFKPLSGADPCARLLRYRTEPHAGPRGMQVPDGRGKSAVVPEIQNLPATVRVVQGEV